MQPDFLSHAERDALAAVMLADTGELAGIFGDDLEGKANPEVRRAWEVDVPEHLTALVEARMSAVRPALEAHFGARLREPDGLAYLRYPPGAFYRAHRDRRATPDSSQHALARRLGRPLRERPAGEPCLLRRSAAFLRRAWVRARSKMWDSTPNPRGAR